MKITKFNKPITDRAQIEFLWHTYLTEPSTVRFWTFHNNSIFGRRYILVMNGPSQEYTDKWIDQIVNAGGVIAIEKS